MDNRIAYSSLVRFLIQRQGVQVIDPGIELSNFDAALCLSPTNCLESFQNYLSIFLCYRRLKLVEMYICHEFKNTSEEKQFCIISVLIHSRIHRPIEELKPASACSL